MKKLISLLLCALMCFAFVACNLESSSPEEDADNDETNSNTNPDPDINKLNLYQEWKSLSEGHVISFDENGNFHINGRTYSYEYDEKESKILVNAGVQISLPVSLVDGVYRINIDGEEYVPSTKYEQLHAEYVKTMMVISDRNGNPAINSASEKYYIDRVELTVDNWNDYIKEYSYDVEVVERDAFNEITKQETVTVYRLGYGTDKYHCLSATIELKHKQTGKIILFGAELPANLTKDIDAVSDTPFNLEEYECTRIKGYLYFINYPEEVLEEVMRVSDRSWWGNDSNASITITDNGMEGYWSVDRDAKVIQSNSDNWAYFFE